MSIEFKKIETAEEYIDLVEKLSYLVDKELTKLEKRIEKEGVSSILGARPQVISLVNMQVQILHKKTTGVGLPSIASGVKIDIINTYYQ